MATLTVYPSLDGHVADGNNDLTWVNLIAEPGMYSVDDGAYGVLINITASATTNQWKTLYRSIFLFDTSALPDGCQISSATLSIYGRATKADALSITPDINVYASNPASSTVLTGTDFATLGSTPFCDIPITYANWNEGTPGTANEFVLNAAGLAAISKTGITKLGIRNANYDVSGDAPGNWVSAAASAITCWFNEQGTTYRPKLVIEYTGTYPIIDPGTLAGLTRVSSIRHIFRPGFFRMQVGLGDLGFDVDVAETAVRRELDTAKPAEPAVSPATGRPLPTRWPPAPGEFPDPIACPRCGMIVPYLELATHLRTMHPAPTKFPTYEAQIEYEEWFQQQIEELRKMGWKG